MTMCTKCGCGCVPLNRLSVLSIPGGWRGGGGGGGGGVRKRCQFLAPHCKKFGGLITPNLVC